MNKSTTSVRRALLAGLGLALVLGACVERPKEYDWSSGGDELRKNARKLFVGQNITDSISDPKGDHTDWKQVRIREPGTMGVTVSIDSTRTMDGYISIKDGFGVELERRPISAGESLYVFDRIPVYQGDYFIQLFIETGDSVYTAGVTFDALPGADIPPPDPDQNGGGGVVVGPRNGGGGGGGGGVVVPKDTPKDEPRDEPKDEPKDDDEGFVSLRGRIARFVPLDEGGTLLTIAGFGSTDGVSAGMSGTIVGLGQSFRITKVTPRSAIAVTPAEAEQLGPYKTVMVRVKK